MQRPKRDFPRLRNFAAPNALIMMYACIADFVHELIPNFRVISGLPLPLVQSGSRCLAYPLQREPHQGT